MSDSPEQYVRAREQLLTVAEVASLLQVSRATVYGMVSRGELVPVALPVRKTRFTHEAIEALIRGAVS